MIRAVAALLAALALAPAAAAAPRAVVAHGRIELDGRPFFPILQWLQCPSVMDESVRLGVDVFLGNGCRNSDADELAATASRHVWSVLEAPASATGPSLLGWHFQDEPDGNGTPPAAIARRYARVRGRGVSFLTVTADFASWSKRRSPALYRAYARATDVIGTDVYPVTGWCRPDWLPRVGETQRELVRLAGGRPTFQWIEAESTSTRWCTGRGVTAPELRAEVWDAIANGAKAIGYFTHSWRPDYSQFRVSPPVQAEMRRTDTQIRAFAPAILGTPLPLRVDWRGGRVDAIARRAGGRTYVFAVNVARTPATATLAFAGRTLRIALPPLGVRVGPVG
ncbi:MAG TPA: hypothetical protein VFL66_02095 [Gaiellaceae bacterium]|nr:hypothetical protein [Gaiellaceae bacterium]